MEISLNLNFCTSSLDMTTAIIEFHKNVGVLSSRDFVYVMNLEHLEVGSALHGNTFVNINSSRTSIMFLNYTSFDKTNDLRVIMTGKKDKNLSTN